MGWHNRFHIRFLVRRCGGVVGSLLNDVVATHKDKIERKVSNLVAKMTRSAGMTRLQLADNEPFKLDDRHSRAGVQTALVGTNHLSSRFRP